MTAEEIYLDNAASTRVLPEVCDAVELTMRREYANPSSLHAKGLEAERILKEARRRLAGALGAAPEEVIFTSGATEANNLAIKGGARARAKRGSHIVTTAFEHSSVLGACRDLELEGFQVTRVPVGPKGWVDPEAVAEAVREETVLVSVMAVNNELGTVQPLERIVQEVRRRKEDLLIHSDGVQAFLKVPFEPRRAGVDLFTLSGHKAHAPKGVGALWVREGVRLQPLFGGGEHERGLRPGTENVPGIAGLGKAVEILYPGMEERAGRLRALKRLLYDEIAARVELHVNGGLEEPCAPHILNVSIPGVPAETLVHALAERNVYVSTGSACTSRLSRGSHVLEAIGLAPELVRSSVRISLSHFTTEDEVRKGAEAIAACALELRAVLGRRAHRRG